MFIIPPIGRTLRRDVLLTQIVPTVVVFIVLLVLAIVSWQSTERTLEAQQARALDEHKAFIETALAERMSNTSKLIRGGAGLFNASSEVTEDEWQHFYELFSREGQYRGVSVIGYTPLVPENRKAEFEQLLRSVQGDNDLQVFPEGERELYTPILYTFEFDDKSVSPLGYDMASEENRREALLRARDTGRVSMTNVVRLISTNEQGVIQYIPVYARNASIETQEERRAALRGFVHVAIRTEDLFSGMQVQDASSFGYSVSSVANGTEQLVYQSQYVRGSPDQEPAAESQVIQYGQQWTIRYYSNEGIVSPAESARPLNVLLAGCVLAIIASLAVFFLIRYRTHLLSAAEEQKLQKAKNELLSLASHQLRTPATGVKQYVGMVLDGFGGPVKKDQAKLLEQAYKSNERQLQIINEFLYVAKLGSGSLTTSRRQFNLAPIVQDVFDEMRIEISEHDHDCSVKIPKNVPVFADQHSIRMIIENMLANAIKYTQPGGKIGIRVVKGLREARVEISDTGVGIAKKDLQLLFKQFSRIPNELSNEVGGSGIGLYLAQQLAIRNGGSITVESEVGKGSTFTLHLPLKKVKNLTKSQQ